MASVLNSANTLRNALWSGKGISFGAWQMLPGSYLSRVIARSGVDWICIDCEHGNIADSDMHESVHAAASCGVSPIVRIPANEGWMVKRALDAGAHGIIVPLLYTVEDAKNLVQWAKFPPMGKRGFGSPFSMGSFDVKGGLTGFEYMNAANDNLLTIVQIETKEAFENVEQIANVPGIDVLFVGPWDLGNNLGFPVKGDFAPELKEAIAKVQKVAEAAGKKSGIYCPNGDFGRKFADEGFQMISVAGDMTVLPAGMTDQLSKAKGSWTHSATQAMKGAASASANLVSQDQKR